MLVTAFRSPVTAAAFTASIPRSTFLACHFTSESIHSAARSVFCSAADPRFASAVGRLNASDPLQLPRSTQLAAFPASTPLRDCYIPPDQSVQQHLLPASPSSEPARFPFAPRRRLLSLGLGCGSPFPVRYVSGGLLFLKPLGTFLNMLPIASAVNRFSVVLRYFPQVLCSVLCWSYSPTTVNSM